MPLYDYKCFSCGDVKEIVHSMNDVPTLECSCGGTDIRKVILQAPATVIPPQHQAAGFSKFKYWGIKNPITGEGITKDTDVSEPCGIRVKALKGDK
jgi:putative FmdB family regulatory protein